MNHNSFRHLISAFVDGELPERDQQRALDHLRTCEECRAYERGLRRLSADLHKAASLDLAPAFPERVLRSVRLSTQTDEAWMVAELHARKLVGALVVAVLVLVGLSFIAGPDEPVPLDPFLSAVQSDSTVSRSLLAKETISKEDVLLAAVTGN